MDEPVLLSYDAKTVVEIDEEGWVTFFSHEYDEDDYSYFGYDAYNLKYKRIEGYEGRIFDIQTGEIVSKGIPGVPYLSLDLKLGEKIPRVEQYFLEKTFPSTITITDLADLDVPHIDKSQLVRMYNQMIVSAPLPQGRYVDYPEAALVQEQKTDEVGSFRNGWQVGYYNSHGVLMAVRIDFLKNGQYLSDGGELFGAQAAQTYARVQEIEDAICAQQSFAVAFDETSDQTVDFKRLKTLLQAMEQGDRQT